MSIKKHSCSFAPGACVFLRRLQMALAISLSVFCPGLGVLSDRDQTGGSQRAGPGLTTRGATLHGDPTQQRLPGPEACPHEGSAQLHPEPH